MGLKRGELFKESIEYVFGLTGGELNDSIWNGFTYWYDGVPDYCEGGYKEGTYRTAIVHTLYHEAPKEVGNGDGVWDLVETYLSSGEAVCPFREGIVTKEHLEENSSTCGFCSEPLGGNHGFIYIGDGWVEAIYKLREE